MEPWLIPLILFILVIIGGWGGYTAVNRRMLSSRQRQWRALQQRYDKVFLDTTGYDTDPGRALEAPGWLDRKNPLVQGFSGTLRRSQQRRSELEIDSANPSKEQIEQFRQVVEQLEDAHAETDRAIKTLGWSDTSASKAPHAQFLLDHRWGAPACYPPLGDIDLDSASGAVKAFLDRSFPIKRTTVIEVLKKRCENYTAANRAQKALRELVENGRYKVDAQGFLWPAGVAVENWGVHRTFGRGADIRLEDVPTVEIANAAWVLLEHNRRLHEHELVEQMSKALGLDSQLGTGIGHLIHQGFTKGLQTLAVNVPPEFGGAVPKGLPFLSSRERQQQRLIDGIYLGLATARLQRQGDGTISRLRNSWPASYRN